LLALAAIGTAADFWLPQTSKAPISLHSAKRPAKPASGRASQQPKRWHYQVQRAAELGALSPAGLRGQRNPLAELGLKLAAKQKGERASTASLQLRAHVHPANSLKRHPNRNTERAALDRGA